MNCYVNDDTVACAQRSNCNHNSATNLGSLFVNTTLQLEKGDEVSITISGYLCDLYDETSTYFECRLVSVIEE